MACRKCCRLVTTGALLLVSLVLAGCSESREKPDLLLITLDTLRADHLGCYGYPAARTPNIDALAAAGILYENAYSPVPSTLPSHATILTGLYPHQHGVRDNGVYFLPEEQVTLAEMLAREGYVSAAFVSAYVLNNRFGIGQGFDSFDDEMELPMSRDGEITNRNLPQYSRWWMKQWSEPYQRIAENTVDRASRWIRDNHGEEPFFCWVHLFDPHMPYSPPDPWRDGLSTGYTGRMDGTLGTVMDAVEKLDGRIRNEDLERMIELYDCEVAYMDHEVGRLVATLDEIGARENTLILLVADHGEGFGEHLGMFFEHNKSVYDEVLRVPFILVDPSGKGAGTRDDRLVSLVDVVPTARDALGLSIPADLPGQSLLNGRVRDAAERVVYFEAMCAIQALPLNEYFKGVRTRDWKLFSMFSKEDEDRRAVFLYDTDRDPQELDNRMTRLHEVESRFEFLKTSLIRFIRAGRTDEKNPSNFWPLTEDNERLEKMRALGYVK